MFVHDSTKLQKEHISSQQIHHSLPNKKSPHGLILKHANIRRETKLIKDLYQGMSTLRQYQSFLETHHISDCQYFFKHN